MREEYGNKNHINFDMYAKICQKYLVKEEDSQTLLSYYLHNIGSLLHFVDDMVLKDFIILNPQWAVDAVYSVLDSTQVDTDNGQFKQSKLDKIWKDYSVEERAKLLALMKKDIFEICYEIQKGESNDPTFVAPQLLTSVAPHYDWNNNENLNFRFQYPFMPYGIITRLIVRLNNLILDDLVWNKGVVLEDKNTKARVIQNANSDGLKVIDISIMGEKSKQKYLLYKIREEINSIHQKWFKNIIVEEMIVCTCNQCKGDSKPYYFKHSVLENYQKETMSKIKCHKYFNDIEVSYLLEGVFLEKEKEHIKDKNYKSEEIEHKKVIPWYKEWWFYGLVWGSITVFIVFLLLASKIVSLVVGIIVGIIIYNRNPKKRFFNIGFLLLTAILFFASPPLLVKGGFVLQDAWLVVEYGKPIHIGIVIILAVMTMSAFVLDFFERR